MISDFLYGFLTAGLLATCIVMRQLMKTLHKIMKIALKLAHQVTALKKLNQENAKDADSRISALQLELAAAKAALAARILELDEFKSATPADQHLNAHLSPAPIPEIKSTDKMRDQQENISNVPRTPRRPTVNLKSRLFRDPFEKAIKSCK
jgi:hypothetical protein